MARVRRLGASPEPANRPFALPLRMPDRPAAPGPTGHDRNDRRPHAVRNEEPLVPTSRCAAARMLVS